MRFRRSNMALQRGLSGRVYRRPVDGARLPPMPLLPLPPPMDGLLVEPEPFMDEPPPTAVDGEDGLFLNVPLLEAALPLVVGALLLAAVPLPVPALAPLVAYGAGWTLE